MKLFSIALMCILSISAVAEEATQALYDKLKTVKTLKGTFEQVVIDDQGVALQETSGEFMLQRPGLFRWETTNPYPQLVVANKDVVWLYDPDLEQVTEKRYDKNKNDAPIWLLTADLSTLQTDYKISQVADGKSQTFELLPRRDGHFFKKLTVIYQGGDVKHMAILDNVDQLTKIDLNITEKNQAIPSAVFDFKIPDGVDVIHDDQ